MLKALLLPFINIVKPFLTFTDKIQKDVEVFMNIL